MDSPVEIETSDGDDGQLVRLQKAMADAGIGSRRMCEDLIGQGRVSVDGEQVTKQGVRLNPETAVIRVDGERLVTGTARRYLMMNKPVGVVSTMADDRGRLSVGDLLGERSGRLFHVGRLDADSEGLLLVTNDGTLAHRLMHPSFEVPKTYLVQVPGRVSGDTRRILLAGILLDDGPAKADAVKVVDSTRDRTLLEIRIHEGRTRLVRRMLDSVGHPVEQLVRVQLGPLRLGDLRSGTSRRLNREEVTALYTLVDL